MSFQIGDQALLSSSAQHVVYPVRNGLVEDWDMMESFWHRCLFQYLRVDSQDHALLLTEPPQNTPENREKTAEIMFETFNVPSLCMGMQAVLALYASRVADSKEAQFIDDLTGIVVDAGEGTTHAIPVVDGYVLGANIKSMPIAGRDITAIIQQLIRERGEDVPPELSMEVSRHIKEHYGYTANDLAAEFLAHERNPDKYVKTLRRTNRRTGKEFSVRVGYERFVGAELLFTPALCSGAAASSPSLPALVDAVVQACPIDTRRRLYGNVVLSGGTSTLRGFGGRLQRELMDLTAARLPTNAKAIEVSVVTHHLQRYASWFGGSVFANTPQALSAATTREQYQEHGPRVCRRSNYMFRDL